MPESYELVATNQKPEPGVLYRTFWVFRGPYPAVGSALRNSFDAGFRVAERVRGVKLKGIIYWHPSDTLDQVIKSKTGVELGIPNTAKVGRWSPWALEFYWEVLPSSEFVEANLTIGAALAVVLGLVALLGLVVLVIGPTFTKAGSVHPGILNPGTLAVALVLAVIVFARR